MTPPCITQCIIGLGTLQTGPKIDWAELKKSVDPTLVAAHDEAFKGAGNIFDCPARAWCLGECMRVRTLWLCRFRSPHHKIPLLPTTTGIKWPTFDSSATVADVKAKFAEFKKQAEALSAQAEKAVAEIEKEVAKTERIKEKVSSMTIDEYLEEFPEETKVIDEQSLKDSMMP